jgi:N-methylhydantoinase B/oxoprolinase/acetone carboxylase alpha subunit
MNALCDKNGPKPLEMGCIIKGVKPELVHSLEVENQTTSAAVHFEALIVLATGREASCFKGTNSPVVEMGQKGRAIVYSYLAPLSARCGCRALHVDREGAFFDEGGTHPYDISDFPY